MILDLIPTEVFHFLTTVGCKNIIKFGADMSASVHIDNKKKRYLDFW